ncbi:hypothetical protein MIND_01248100 [Mycena indigotica]|uniref:F-box domain-containing protein n=1 Tax=Mycena indigotica TaxID=2126181 RepID=A0A8H6S4J0_9AGAR|nr:uncharacterized protein MIND_01248100 [Mycena indigotica]KAF7292208.1 hypothetical protein MIND_01248100 [Mycena indigotica]
MPSSSPALPPELELVIFQTAAKASLHTLYTLLLVARRTRLWLEPLLYQTLRFSREYKSPNLTAMDPSRHAFLAHTVRHVVISGHIDADIPPFVAPLRICSQMTHLALGFSTYHPVVGAALLLLRHLRCLAFDPRVCQLTASDAALPVFAGLTHLELFKMLPDTAEFCAALPRLTHLALNTLNEAAITQMLAACPRLELLVILQDEENPMGVLLSAAPAALTHDQRLVITAYVDWDEGVLDSWNYWAVAEEFLAQKRSGAIPKTQFVADRDET